LGTLSNAASVHTKQVEEAFKNSELLQKYCKDNDIHMIMSANSFGYCRKNFCYASLDLMKIFPKPELNFFGKIINLFKSKPHEAVIIHTYGEDRNMAVSKLLESIESIKSERDLQRFISYKKYNPVEMKKCEYCGWNSHYRGF
ncbi:MAG: hypothetical protein K2F57_06720, partial [Candidatus Gastranaerophilales bacterium]|nr:hypothetical protein [Candidatus Gastranaerophilales bacterium]